MKRERIARKSSAAHGKEVTGCDKKTEISDHRGAISTIRFADEANRFLWPRRIKAVEIGTVTRVGMTQSGVNTAKIGCATDLPLS